MHESPNRARDTGQGEKGQPGARARECSRVQEEVGVDAGAAQGCAVFTIPMNSERRPYVEKLDAFSVYRAQTSRGDLEGLNDKACATRPGLDQTFDSAKIQSRHWQPGRNMSRGEDKNTTPRATGQPKVSITASRLSINNQALQTLWVRYWSGGTSHVAPLC
ncbi:uncharacterized protein M421DRAFT_119179 [Didymella exigua CBS 183.55]|uniref:Uncharacterized protein n=1 Tax=Didymella exigua CBS 183.55 TaxID=1150837 RepID=A0A6A5S136_9PLEO|nr:uncharacterized protein M421DRAFT_119179 [Didymella exigua CBS 183.55]KAF1934361.1 hypothetical protein M421DRAFT_119179 [Didymella exigua CBS 183.55]